MTYVLDASALFALIDDEPGAETVSHFLMTAETCISTVNLTEVIAKHMLRGNPPSALYSLIADLTSLHTIAFDEEQARYAGEMVLQTKKYGLSAGDRACLALAKQRNGIAVTADTAWEQIDAGVQIELIRTSSKK